MTAPAVGLRWTIGDVSHRGFEALRLSLWGAHQVFGPDAACCVCVNGLTPDEARRRTGVVPKEVEWRASGGLPDFLRSNLTSEMAEGVAWKFAPLRIFLDRFEIALDNDCILWDMPETIECWLAGASVEDCLMRSDVRMGLGQFEDLCGDRLINSGIRGLPAGFDLAAALRETLRERPVTLRSELNEQGLQAAALSRRAPLALVSVDQVTICSPFWPHLPHLGRAGAHFVGLNARALPWSYYDRPASTWIQEHWERHRPELHARVGLA